MTDSMKRAGGSPFEPEGRSRAAAVIVSVSSVILVAAAAATAWFMTRGSAGDMAADEPSHNHSAPGGGMLAPVRLDDAEARRIGVTYADAVRGSLPMDVRAVGQVAWNETRTRAVAPRVEGWVERLFVDFTGQDVRAGEPMLEMYAPMLVAAHEELLLAARLVRDVASGTEEARRSAEDLLSAARRRLLNWEVPAADIERVERSGQVPRTIVVHASHDGVVVEKAVVQGQRVMAGETLYRLADAATVWVEGQVFESDVPYVRTGQRVSVEAQSWPGERWPGRVAYVYPEVDASTRTTRVRVELANPGRRLKPGMFATLQFEGVRREGVLTVPRSAVLATGERSLVFVRSADGLLVPREVVTGLASGELVEIRSGLAAGERVVASATFLIDAESSLRAASGSPAMGAAPPAAPAAGAAPKAGRVPDDHAAHGASAGRDTIRPEE